MKIISLVVGLTVGVLLMVGLVSPVVADGQITAGNQIIKTNESLINDLADYYNEDVELIITSPVGTGSITDATITINDYSIPLTGHSITVPIVFSEKDYLQIESSTSTTQIGIYRFYLDDGTTKNGNLTFGHTYTISYDHSAKTIAMNDLNLSNSVSTDIIDDLSVEYFFAIKDNGSYSLTRETAQGGNTAFRNMFVTQSSIDDETAGLFRVAASTTIGEDNVGYAVGVSKYGVSTWCANENYTVTATVAVNGLTIAEGTTDILTNGTPTINVVITNNNTNESVTVEHIPEVSWVIHKVTGHESSGANYALLKAIPIVAFIALIAFAAFAVRGRMDD